LTPVQRGGENMARSTMSPEEYVEYRKQLWARRGPNVVTADGGLLPCYRHALDKLRKAAPPPPPIAVRKAQVTPAARSPHAAPRSRIINAMRRGVEAGAREPFYVVDLGAASAQLALWHAALPRVEPFYAVKCNGDPGLLLTLAAAGVGFDCASMAEMQAVMALGVDARRLLYANPIKQPSHVEHARAVGVNLTVFDAEEELHKMAQLHPDCQLLLRIAVDDSQAQCVLSNKYGAQPQHAAHLLDTAYRLCLNVVGVSFHVGSGSGSADPFADAIARADAVFRLAAARGKPMHLLDVGGGFPGSDAAGAVSFKEMAAALSAAIDRHFPPERGVRIIAEPGRFFAASTHALAANIIGKKVAVVAEASNAADCPTGDSDSANSGAVAGPSAAGVATSRVMYYINDGLYGSFNCVLYDHATPECAVLPPVGNTSEAATTAVEAIESSEDGGVPVGDAATCSVWGPTCDGIDCVLSNAKLSPSLAVGEWLYFTDMGAYTACAGSNFNGMALPDVVYLQATGSESRPQPPHVAAAQILEQLAEAGIRAE